MELPRVQLRAQSHARLSDRTASRPQQTQHTNEPTWRWTRALSCAQPPAHLDGKSTRQGTRASPRRADSVTPSRGDNEREEVLLYREELFSWSRARPGNAATGVSGVRLGHRTTAWIQTRATSEARCHPRGLVHAPCSDPTSHIQRKWLYATRPCVCLIHLQSHPLARGIVGVARIVSKADTPLRDLK